MRKSKFTESQIVGILKEAEAGVPVPDLLRRHGVSRASFFLWRRKYAGVSVIYRTLQSQAAHARWKAFYRDQRTH
jgi:putative transposase